MTLSKTLYPLLSTGLTQEDPSQHDPKSVDWEVKNQIKQTFSSRYVIVSSYALLS